MSIHHKNKNHLFIWSWITYPYLLSLNQIKQYQLYFRILNAKRSQKKILYCDSVHDEQYEDEEKNMYEKQKLWWVWERMKHIAELEMKTLSWSKRKKMIIEAIKR